MDVAVASFEEAWWYDGQMIRFRSETGNCMLNLMSAHPYMTYKELAQSLGINYSAMQKMLEGMRKKGYLDRRDDGRWHVLAINSKV